MAYCLYIFLQFTKHNMEKGRLGFCPDDALWSLLESWVLHGSLYHWVGGTGAPILLLLTGIISTATLCLGNTDFPIILIVKLKFRELKQLLRGHTARHKPPPVFLPPFHLHHGPAPGSTVSLLFWNTRHVCNLILANTPSHQTKGHLFLKQRTP